MAEASPIDPARWQRLSPLLDELLDLDAPERATRLDALRQAEPTLAGELAQLLAQDEALAAARFLERPAAAPRGGPRAGMRVGAYVLERELGTGGMGSVWLARRDDGRFEGQAAIKFVRAGLAGRGEAERFAREGRILARLAHPHIARLLDAGLTLDTDLPYLVIEHVDGQPIDQFAQARRLDVPARVRLLLDVLEAVAHAHNRLILHRDLKPSNILVSDAGEVKLLDFGISKLLEGNATGDVTEVTAQAGLAFTPQYAAPEQWEGAEVTTATDVYALGVLAYRLLGGGHPTAAEDATQPALMRGALETEPQRLSDAVRRQGAQAGLPAQALEGDLDTIVAKALKKPPAERYPNAAAMAEDLRRWLAHEPIAARADSLAYRSAKFLRRNRLAVAAAALTVAGLATGLVVALQQAQEASRRQAEAEGLIEFMLGDLRTKLQPVGRLDVLDAVGAKALAHYSEPGAALDAAAQGRQARALHLLGEIAEQRGDLDEAGRLFARAERATASLLARTPGDGRRLFDHAQSQYWMGFIALRRAQFAAAESSFRSYVDLAERLVALEPGKLDWQVERAYALQNLGVLQLRQGRAAEALKAFETTRARWQPLLVARPALVREQANTLGWIAQAQDLLGRYDAAADAQHAKLEALAQVPDAERDRDVQVLRANGWVEIGRLQLARGNAVAAREAQVRAVALLQSLVALDATNLDWQARLGWARLGLTESLLTLGERAAAAMELDRAEALLATLLAGAAPRPAWRLDLRGQLLVLRARWALAADATAAEPEAWRSRLRQMSTEWPAGRQATAGRILVSGGFGLALGDLEQRTGQAAAARQAWQAALAHLGADQTSAAPALTLRGLLEARLGNVPAARELAERVKTSTYRHPLAAELIQMAATGSR